MANFLFENKSKTESKCIEIIKCPNTNDCNNEIGDGRYDNFIIQPDQSQQVNTKCNEICWRHSGDKNWNRTNSTVISV